MDKKNILRFENEVCTADVSFIAADKYTFSVLMRILSGECKLTLTDGEKFVICHSSNPYPVWVWHSDDIGDEEMELVYSLIKENFSVSDTLFNMKSEPAKRFIERAAEDGYLLEVVTDMLAYRCENLVAPVREVEGFMETAAPGDEDEVVDILREFNADAATGVSDESTYRENAKRKIKTGLCFFWNNGSERVACCALTESGDQCSVNSVHTRRPHRRKGYASKIVYEVTKIAMSMGKEPTLYTDANYVASNACYTQLGYEMKGGLASVGVKRTHH